MKNIKIILPILNLLSQCPSPPLSFLAELPTKSFQRRKLWSEERDKELKKQSKQLVLDSIKKSESKLKPSWKEMFQDVYHEMAQHLKDQMKEVEGHLKIYKEH
uniref:2-oxoisovalerate dehydrogenase subunit alpha n=1 Tax=Cacopsylla melanoneura TaxID=428564 RepID=A0A8D8XZY0_9HEMI